MNETAQTVWSDDVSGSLDSSQERFTWYSLAKPLVRPCPLIVVDVFA